MWRQGEAGRDEVDKEILQQEAELAVIQYRKERRHNLYGSFISSEWIILHLRTKGFAHHTPRVNIFRKHKETVSASSVTSHTAQVTTSLFRDAASFKFHQTSSCTFHNFSIQIIYFCWFLQYFIFEFLMSGFRSWEYESEITFCLSKFGTELSVEHLLWINLFRSHYFKPPAPSSNELTPVLCSISEWRMIPLSNTTVL